MAALESFVPRKRGPATRPERLGTFIGVFTPSILTILGVILFLRTGWVVGNVGLVGAVTIVVIANAVTIVTAASLSAVATNMRVGAGGAYYILSRSLGVEIGAAIGIPLFLAQAFSVTLYAFGLAESLQLLWPGVPQRPVAAGIVLIVSILAARGSGLALRLQLPIMAAIGLALITLGIGVARNVPDTIQLTAAGGAAFWVVFAVFFPAVTGILAGVSLSGDLDRPARSIPRGTMSAVLVGFAVYLIVVIALGIAASPGELVADNLIWFTLAGGISFLIYPGLWGAIFSSAVGSILGAPRTLQAMVDDRVLPRVLGRRIRGVRGPGVPLVLSMAVALGAVSLGDLNAVAPALTMFFLTAYGMVNLVAGVERLAGDPSYRPTFQVPWWLSLAGAFGCFLVMFRINPLALMMALVIEVAVYLVMRRRALTAPWGDLRRGALMALVRSTVLQLKRLPQDSRNWRPNILLFAGDVMRRRNLVRFGAWLALDRGILTIADLRVGSLHELGPAVTGIERQMNADIDALGIAAFGEVEIVADFVQGAIATAQANGIAGIESNTVMFGWSDKPERRADALTIIEELATLGISAIICNPRPLENGHRRRIDVWWGGLQSNGDMLVLLAHLLSLNPEWRDAVISAKSIATSDMMLERNRLLLERVVRNARIRAETMVIRKPAEEAVLDVIKRESGQADVVLLGLRAVERGGEAAYAARIEEMIEQLPSVLFVRSAGEFRGRLLGEDAAAIERR
jgi:potassium/chloride transporter 4/5/6